ncbi:MAG: HdeD family acid-resistance protein [Tannerellaceae bacterium]
MNNSVLNFWGKSSYWWLYLILGAMLVLSGFWVMWQPALGYETVAILFGWSLLAVGISQIAIAASVKRAMSGWGWWIAGGIIDIMIGLFLLFDLGYTEAVLPYIFGFIFLFKGISNFVSSLMMVGKYKYWWLYLINGILLLVLSWMFLMAPASAVFTIVFMAAFLYMYWGFSLMAYSFDLKPGKNE